MRSMRCMSARGHHDRMWLYEPQQASSPINQLQYENRLRLALEQNILDAAFSAARGLAYRTPCRRRSLVALE